MGRDGQEEAPTISCCLGICDPVLLGFVNLKFPTSQKKKKSLKKVKKAWCLRIKPAFVLKGCGKRFFGLNKCCFKVNRIQGYARKF